MGYATCWIGAFDEDEVSKIIKVTEGIKPVSMIPIGHSVEKETPRRPRRTFGEVVINEEF